MALKNKFNPLLSKGIQKVYDDYPVIAMQDSGFVSWDAGTTYYTITGGALRVDRGGTGIIKGEKVTWLGGQTTGAFAVNTLNYVYIDNTGTIGSVTSGSSTLYRNNIVLFEVLYDGTNYEVVKENHPASFDTDTSGWIHNNIGIIIQKDTGADTIGATATRVTTGTGGVATDREVKIVGQAIVNDHGLLTTIPDSAGAGVTWNFYYTNASGKWIRYAQQTQLPMFYNNAGTPTALTTTTNGDIGVFRLYVSKDDLNGSIPHYFAVMHTANFNTAGQANTAIANGNIAISSGELAGMELAQLGYAIVKNNVSGGYIDSIVIQKSVVNTQYAQGGNTGQANLTLTDTTNFNKNLSSIDTNVQQALETLDELSVKVPNWTTTTSYLSNDIVYYAPQEVLLRCITAHISGAFDVDLAYWECMTNDARIVSYGLSTFRGQAIEITNTSSVKAIATADNTCATHIVAVIGGSPTSLGLLLAKSSGKITLATGLWDAIAGTTGGLTAGQYYLLSNTTAGNLTSTEPTTNYRQTIIKAANSTSAEIVIGEPQGITTAPTASYTTQNLVATGTAVNTDWFINCNGTFTLNLYPLAQFSNGTFGLVVKNSGTGTITIDGDGAETIDGLATYNLLAGASVKLIPIGGEWKLV